MKRSSKVRDIFQVIERLLKIRPRSVGELRHRLREKGFDVELVETVLKELESKNILNDRAFADWWITQRSSLKPTGAFGLLMELKEKKVEDETAQQAILKSGVKESELELAQEALGRRLSRYNRLDLTTRRRRIVDFLRRRGFSSGTITSIIKSI